SSGRQLQRYTVDNIKLSGIDISPDGKYFATCGNSGYARIWHLDVNSSTPMLYKEFKHIGSQVAYIKFSPDGKRFITTEQLSKLAILWDIETGDSLFSLTHTSKEDIVPINSANFHISERGSFII